MRRIVAIMILAVILSAGAAHGGGPSTDGSALALRQALTEDGGKWRTVDDSGAPVDCVFIAHEGDGIDGIVFLSYTTWEDRAIVTRKEMLTWRVLEGDILDIENNYFVAAHTGRLFRIDLDTQTVWPASW